MMEDYPGQKFFHKHNQNIKATEDRAKTGETSAFTEQEQKVITDLARRLDISEHKVLVQGLRAYQLIAIGTHRLEEVSPALRKLPTNIVQYEMDRLAKEICEEEFAAPAAGRAAAAPELSITPDLVFRALIAELDHPSGYITKDPMSLSSVTVDGTIGCDSIAEFLNNALRSKAGQ